MSNRIYNTSSKSSFDQFSIATFVFKDAFFSQSTDHHPNKNSNAKELRLFHPASHLTPLKQASQRKESQAKEPPNKKNPLGIYKQNAAWFLHSGKLSWEPKVSPPMPPPPRNKALLRDY